MTPNPLLFYKNNRLDKNSYDNALRQHKIKYTIIFTTGSVVIGVGLALEILGIHHRVIYLNKAKNTTLGFANNGLGLLLTIK